MQHLPLQKLAGVRTMILIFSSINSPISHNLQGGRWCRSINSKYLGRTVYSIKTSNRCQASIVIYHLAVSAVKCNVVMQRAGRQGVTVCGVGKGKVFSQGSEGMIIGADRLEGTVTRSLGKA